jgi:phosphoribosylformimino-5-aminoimidazole carboxamide ribotide isomerase
VIVIPAIDLKEGRCVRLVQGRMDQESVFSEDPLQMARRWEEEGAERLHVVDLNGAVGGRPFHQPLIEKIARSLRIPVEVGGGIRDIETIETYLTFGVGWVILGTAALKNRQLVEEACQRFPGRIILGIDARKGKVAIEGWKSPGRVEAVDLARQFQGTGLSAIIYTDIERDGTGKGLNLEETKMLAEASPIPVIASGGVSRIRDFEDLMALEPDGVMGVVVGRALYTGQIDLREALRLTRKSLPPQNAS